MRAPKEEILNQDKLLIPPEYLRFATPASVALYRAERLKCNTIAEIGCGIGGQTFAFAETCKKVIAVEIHPGLYETAKNNIEALGIKNVELILGDGLSDDIVKKIKKEKPDIVFCDTERKLEGERTIDDLRPDLRELMEKYSFCDKIAIEVPPYTNDLDRLKGKREHESFEQEFISLNGKLNRLTLYFNKLKQTEKSAVSLPSKTRIEKNETKKVEFTDSAIGFKHLYTIDPSITMAGIINDLAAHLKRVKLMELNKKSYFLSKEKIESDFLVGYKILDVCENKFETILESLKKADAKSVVLRYTINPLEYWKERKKYESQLIGKKKVHLFANNEAILCESLKY